MREIVLCLRCEGKGYKVRSELTDYHKREYREDILTCANCKGSGRLVKVTSVSFEPYVTPQTEGDE